MTVKFSFKRAAMATVTMLGCYAAVAGEPVDAAFSDTAVRWSVGGFGTLGVTHSSSNQADFTASALTSGDAGYSRSWTPAVDSRAGVQLCVNFSSSWSAVVQLVSERTERDGYAPVVEWANLQYHVTPDLSVRAGRIALPLFLTGDSRKAGYSMPWVRPPVELYGAIPLSSSDGVDASYRWQLGDINNVTQVFYGRTDLPLTPTARVQAHALKGLSNTAVAGPLTLRATVLEAHLSVGLAQSLFDGLRQFDGEGTQLAQRYELQDKPAYVASLGFVYDPGKWFAMGEIGRLNARSYLGDKTAAYLSAGYRYGDLTPYLVYGISRPNTPTNSAGLDLSEQPERRAATAAQLNAGLNQLLAAIPRQYSVSAGVRWDLLPNYALKLQYDRITPQQGSSGTFINVQPGFRAGQPIVVLSAALDFVF